MTLRTRLILWLVLLSVVPLDELPEIEAVLPSRDIGFVKVDQDGLIHPLTDGSAKLIVRSEAGEVTVPITVSGIAQPTPVSFQHEVQPILTKSRCNSGGCHGKAEGQNGFKLSLLGFDTDFDHDALTKEGKGRRLSITSPETSLLLRKAIAEAPHGGGRKIEAGKTLRADLYLNIGSIRESVTVDGGASGAGPSAAPGALTADKLAAGTRGFFSAVMLTDAALAYSPDGVTWTSALNATEWATLNSFEANFAVRQVNWSGYPTPDLGFNWPTAAFDSTGNPARGTWSTTAKTSFPYLVTSNQFAVSNVWTYLATPLDTNTTPWLTDANGNALIAVKKYPDGHEVLTLTFDNAPWLTHSTVLAQGLLTWASRGLFLGERHTYLSAQVDDVFLADEMWPAGEFRQTANDWQTVINWQAKFNTRTLGRNFRYDMAFNGLGTDGVEYPNDDLTPYVRTNKAMFKWISHTYNHPYLDTLTYAESLPEITKNNQAATGLGLPNYSRLNMVTPNVSGLSNALFLQAAYTAGLRYLVSDTSIPAHRPPSPNVGIPNWIEPRILMIPRHANNLYYNVSTPDEWVSEYNSIYHAYWGRDLTYAEILDNQAELLLGFLLKGDVSPLMFHQPNLRNYDGAGSTLLGDLLTAVANKYESLYNFPALSPTMNNLGTLCQQRMNYNASGVVATRNADNTVTLTVQNAARIPVTGLKNGGVVSYTGTVAPVITAETYAGQTITYLTLAAGQSVTVKKL